ncbi:MAG: extracellular solute-binding protein [Chloroflexi bacterium]|nr:extracellular solute-binding protein [Chloroflexota bacterium]
MRQRAAVGASVLMGALLALPGAVAAQEPESAQAVFDRFNAMTGEARTAALVEAAKAEDGFVLYTTAPGYQPAIDAFADKYDIEVELFLGRSDTVLQRVTQEYEAGVHLVDVFEDENARLLQEAGLTYQYVNDELTSQITGLDPVDHMIPFRLSIPAVAWNTDLVADGDIPASVEDLADPKWAGKLVLDSGAWSWYATLKLHMMEQGKSEQEAMDVFRAIIANSSQQPTSIAMTALLSAGEYEVGTSVLTAVVDRNTAVGAPVTWRTAEGGYTSPLVVASEGGALMNQAPHPATAMLFIDFMLTEGSPLLQGQHWPSPIQGDGGTLDGVAEADLLPVPRSVMVEDAQRWSQEWDSLLQGG